MPERPNTSEPERKDTGDETPSVYPDAGSESNAQQAQSIPEARAMTVARVRDLRALLSYYIRRHLPPTPPRERGTEPPPVLSGSYAHLLPILRAIPILLATVFALSFFWDFDGVTVSAFGYTLELQGLLRILSVSGLIGFLTNALAIAMLFHPRQKRPIFGQGLIPAQRERVIYRLAKAVSEELINERIIKQKIEESQVIPRYRELALSVTRGVLEDPDFRRDIKRLAAEYVNEVLASEDVRRKLIAYTVERLEQHAGQGLGGLALKAYRYINEADFQRRIERAIREIPTSLDGALDGLDHLLDRVPEKIEARSEEIEAWVTRGVLGLVENLDVYDMILSNMRQYDEQQLETLLKNSANEQLNYIKYLGGVLGVIGGLVIWRPTLSLAVFGSIGLLLFGLDRALFRPPRQAE